MTIARRWSWSAPATISAAEARAGIDQHDHRQAVRQVARLGVEALDVALLAAALGHDLALLEEGVADLDRLVEQAAGVGAQVDDIAERLAAGRLVDRRSAPRGSASPVWAEKPLMLMMPTPSLTSHLTGLSSIRSRMMATSNGLSRPGRTMVSLIAVPGLAAHLLDRLVEREAVEELAVDVGDVVAGLDPGAVGRRVLGRGDHLDRAILGRDGQAEPAVIAVGGGLQLGEVGRLGIAANAGRARRACRRSRP